MPYIISIGRSVLVGLGLIQIGQNVTDENRSGLSKLGLIVITVFATIGVLAYMAFKKKGRRR